MRRFVMIWAVALTTLLWAPMTSAETRIAFVDTPRVLDQAPQAKAAREKLEQEFAPRDAQLMSSQRELKALQERLERDGAVLSASERSKLERDFAVQQRELKRTQEAFGEDFNMRRNEEISKLQREAGEAIVATAKADGYDIVFESGVVYASDKVDITEKVLLRMRDTYTKQQAIKPKK